MILTQCTITGADDATDPHQLASLSDHYPFLEWAIHWSPSRLGQPLYPSETWRTKFQNACPSVAKALHLTHDGLRAFREGEPQCLSQIASFDRIQLNMDEAQDRDLPSIAALLKRISAFSDQRFIIPVHAATQPLLPLFEDVTVSILFDASGGNGRVPSSWPLPIPHRDCGYAGGLGPLNIVEHLARLSTIVPNGTRIWVDMQSGVRSNGNRLDLAKVVEVAEAIQRYYVPAPSA